VILKNIYFIQVFGRNIVRVFSSSVSVAHIMCGEVVIFGSLDAIMLNP